MKSVSPEQSLLQERILPRSDKVGVSNFFILWLMKGSSVPRSDKVGVPNFFTSWLMKLILYVSSSAAALSLLLPQEVVDGTTVPSLFRDLPNLYQIFLISTVFTFVGAFSSLMNQHKPRVERIFRIIAVASILFALAIVRYATAIWLRWGYLNGIAQNTTGNVFVPKNGVGAEVSGSAKKAILFWPVKLGMTFDLARSESMIPQVFPFNSEKKRGGVAVKLMENSGSVQGRDGGATPDIDWDFDPTPHIGRTGGTTADGLPFSQASNSVEGQEASSSGHNRGSGAGSESDESDQSTGSGGTDTNEGICRHGAGDEHDEDNRDEGNDEDKSGHGELESGTSSRVRNSSIVWILSNARLVSIFTATSVQSTSAIIALSLDGLSPLARKLFTGVLVTNLLGFLCLYVALIPIPSRYRPPWAAKMLVRIGGAAAAFGFLLMMGIKLSLGIIVPACLVILAATVLSFMP